MVHTKSKNFQPQRHYNPLQRERLTSNIYAMTGMGKRPTAKEKLEEPSVKRQMSKVADKSRKEAEGEWQEICRKSNKGLL